jgi:hypothetical protein
MRDATLAAMQSLTAALKLAVLASLVGLLTSGCAGTAGDMVKASEPSTVLVEWRRVLPKGCGSAQHAYGCARVSHQGNLCVIELPEDAPDWALAHEFKHCFGYVHKHADRPRLAAIFGK